MKITEPKHHLFEKVARELAATWYEIGRGQGLTSKYPNARLYAINNLEKFIPVAIEKCIEMLSNPSIPALMKEEIYDALMERVNDPTNLTSTQYALPDVDIKKILDSVPQPSQALEMIRDKPINVKTDLLDNVNFKEPDLNKLSKINPFKTKGH
jgi:hypothetical protein